jgi:hypothetical protein
VDVHSRISFLAVLMLCAGSSLASAQTYEVVSKPRKHFITFSYDWIYTEPLHFAEHPLSDLLGREVGAVQREAYEYRTRDDATAIDVIEFSRRQIGLGASIYPLGMSSGPTLMLRGNIVPLPRIQIEFQGPAPFPRYALLDGRAFDGAIGLMMADRSPGWGLGSHAFIAGGIGKLTSDIGNGSRFFAEGGGGLDVGPIGVELGVKFAWNKLADPVEHRFLTVPITIRGTLTF